MFWPESWWVSLLWKAENPFLAKEKVEEGLNYKVLAMMTEGYSGSDLRVCRFEQKNELIHFNQPSNRFFHLVLELVYYSSISACERAISERKATCVCELHFSNENVPMLVLLGEEALSRRIRKQR